MPDGPTQYGFAWRPMTVERVCDMGREGSILDPNAEDVRTVLNALDAKEMTYAG
jgi:hypothetical protein